MRRASCLACLALAALAIPALAESDSTYSLVNYAILEPVLSESQLISSEQPMYLQNLPNTPGAIIHLSVVMADDRGSCSLTAYGDMASGAKELGSVRATGRAAVWRVLAEPLQALRVASLTGAWFVVICDTPAYAYAAVLASDGSHTDYTEPNGPWKREIFEGPISFTREQLENIPLHRDIEIPLAAPLQAAPSAPPAADGPSPQPPPCATSAECPRGMRCAAEAGGVQGCSLTGDKPCMSNHECPENSICIPDYLGKGGCIPLPQGPDLIDQSFLDDHHLG